MRSGWKLSMALVAASVGMITLPMLAPASNDNETKPDGKGMGTLFNPGNGNRDAGQAKGAKPGGGSTGNGINYHGGPVMLGAVHRLLHLVRQLERQYGHHDPDRLRQQHRRLAVLQYQHHLLQRLERPRQQHLSRIPGRQPTTTRTAPRSPTQTSRASSRAPLAAASCRRTPNGVYFVLTSADVAESQRLSARKYCGWHTHGTICRVTTSSTRSSATPTAAPRPAKLRPPVRTATPAPTGWPA